MAKRKYRLKKRAEKQKETKQRIVEATIHLHETIGVPGTSISAIAELAGVERLTVYRHFSDERSLLTACTGHYLSQNSPPDPDDWESIVDPIHRLRVALGKIYAYHRQTEAMMVPTFRDIDSLPTLQEVLTPLFEYWGNIQDGLAKCYSGSAKTQQIVRAAIGHAIHFQTWHSLVRQHGLEDNQVVDLMVNLVRCASSPGQV